ncbi:MAG: oligosaccharide flippase family protein, partial [Merismopedia sp. SIO2A8]|nr:oligosaccharide flippase family protein [Merismopedia sp. SIO2A8]
MEKSLTQTSPSDISIRNLAQGTMVALGLQIAGVLLTYLVQICLARWMGKAEYGLYTYVMAWCLTLAIPAGLGLPRAVLRFVSEYRVQGEWGRMRGVLLSSWQFTLVM